jgi:hypothetical protein
MAAVITISCDGDWHGMACRGALHVPAGQVTVPVNPDFADLYTARNVAYEQGWSETCGRDYCPAHTQARALEAVALDPRWAGYSLGEQSGVLELLRADAADRARS